MRPILALVISTVILGSVWLYLRAESKRAIAPARHAPKVVEGKFDIEITLTFDAGPDKFALNTSQAPSLIVEYLGQAILRRTDRIAAGTSVLAEGVSRLQRGKNSFFVRCTPSTSDADVARALRIRVLHDRAPVADTTLWSAPGAPCEGVVEVDVQQ